MVVLSYFLNLSQVVLAARLFLTTFFHQQYGWSRQQNSSCFLYQFFCCCYDMLPQTQWLKTTKSSYSFIELKSSMYLSELKSRCCQRYAPFRMLQKRNCFLFIQIVDKLQFLVGSGYHLFADNKQKATFSFWRLLPFLSVPSYSVFNASKSVSYPNVFYPSCCFFSLIYLTSTGKNTTLLRAYVIRLGSAR